MKAFLVIYAQTIKKEQVIQAKNEKEALKKFRVVRPEVKVMDVQTWDEGLANYELY